MMTDFGLQDTVAMSITNYIKDEHQQELNDELNEIQQFWIKTKTGKQLGLKGQELNEFVYKNDQEETRRLTE
jgi:UDP-N-acetylglucosamine transferase subunit ALG13